MLLPVNKKIEGLMPQNGHKKTKEYKQPSVTSRKKFTEQYMQYL